jgi:CRISPR-associated protein Cst1
MKKAYNTVNYEWLTRPTGDPFADAGGFALKELSQQNQDLDILDLIMEATNIYVVHWKSKINPFFLNSKITQPAFDSKKKIEETKKYFLSLIHETAPNIEGICRISGQNTKLFPACRDNSILSGSGTFANFNHCFQGGMMLSKEMIIRFHFIPLACEYLQDKIAIVHSNNSMIAEYFSRDCCKRNLNAIAYNISNGVLKAASRSPGTALFRYVDDVLKNVSLEDFQDYLITLYHFTNFGASPEINIYTLPFEAFSFYKFTQKLQYKNEWNTFVSSYYIGGKDFKNAKYDEGNSKYICQEKNKVLEIEESDYKYWSNKVYNDLLNNQSILKYVLKYSIKHILNFEITKNYEIKIRKMKKETISKIEQMADYILSSNDEQGIKRAIKKLDGVKNSYLLRRFILKDIVAKYYNEGNEDAIVTIEDYADYLFPDTNSWQETRDVLLIAIYQKLHERNVHVDAELSEEDNDLDV